MKKKLSLSEIQQKISSSNLNEKTLLDILAETAHHLTGTRGLAVILFDNVENCAKIHFNDGHSEHSLEIYCKILDAAKIHHLPIKFELTARPNFSYCYHVPIGKSSNPMGVFIIAADPSHTECDSQEINEFIIFAEKTLSDFFEAKRPEIVSK